ncbi:MAG: hypothetical protein DIJKHBIC_02963 [Thermoanaerobaculia bacterium]|nr:hypothetical protein [Thermoanaerobaculia bacterium]
MIVIGRQQPADIVVPHSQVSASHVGIRHLGGDVYEIIDMGSENGTFVNGYRVQRATVRSADILSLGTYVLDLRAYSRLIPQCTADDAPFPPPLITQSVPASAPPAQSSPAARRPARSIGLWIALAVIGIGILNVGIGYLNRELIDRIQASKQRRTMGDIRSIAIAVESYAVDNNRYPPARSATELREYLFPTYIKVMPISDGWDQPLRYEVWGEGLSNYSISSAGEDGNWERSSARDYPKGATRSHAADIVFMDGEFVRYPESALKRK